MEVKLLYIVSTFSSIVNIITGDITLQSSSCSICTSPDKVGCRNPNYQSFKHDLSGKDEEFVRSQDSRYYDNGKRCIVSIKGQPNHQIQIEITSMAVDKLAKFGPDGTPIECHDSLKLYNGPTVDNARLLPGIPAVGLCGQITTGAELADLRVFKTTQNELTIQFETDMERDLLAGFQIRLRQVYFVNPGNLYPSGGNPGGWNDGTFNEFQMNWDDQIILPGGVQPGGDGTDYDKDKNGITCYECNFCPLEVTDPEQQIGSTKSGCYTCSKEWDDEYRIARRKCYSYVNYNYVLQSLAYGGDTVTTYSGCKTFVNNFGRRVNYCFCSGAYCNKGKQLMYSPMLLLHTVSVLLLYILY